MIADEDFMNEALCQAHIAAERDEVPIGAIIVHKGRVIGRAHNQVEMLRDPSAHAEMIALTQATSAISCKWLQDCTIYVTIEPCSMCAGALVLARIHRLVFGAKDTKTGACGSILDIVREKRLNHKIEVSSGVLEGECGALLSDFFRSKRSSQKVRSGGELS